SILCAAEPNLDRVRAEKSLANCCLNGLSAILNKTFAELFSDPETLRRIERLFDECYAILSTEFRLESADVLKEHMVKDWRYAEHYSSTWQDYTAGKPTEIEYLNGYMVKLGQEKRLPVWENLRIVEALDHSGGSQ
ncbi:MAG: ketopantoate reductase C-terminal domain-containing protein, partial [Bacteroidota bacterium]